MGLSELSEKSVRHLELEFSYNKSPDAETKSALSRLTGLSSEDVSKWFVTRLGNDVSSNNESSAALSRSRGSEDVEPEVLSKATVAHQVEGSDDEDESSLPGYMILEANGFSPIRKLNRRRKQFDPRRRLMVAQMRKIGACHGCRKRKVACKHALVAATEEPPTPPTESAAGSSLLHAFSLSAQAEDQTSETSGLATIGNWENYSLDTARSTLPWELHKDTIMRLYENNTLESMMGTMQDKHYFYASIGEYEQQLTHWGAIKNVEKTELEVISVDTEPQTQPVNNSKINNSMPEIAQDGQPDICSRCGFQPAGDPRWHKSNLARHIRIQHNDKLIQLHCPFQGCDRIYRRSDNLGAHIKRVHGS